ncbi:MAG: accessory gene regulator B family protein [Oscillospiraceae bacterium]|jgi:accessory gene regulator B|nr:accessory gene regulator B family protein [Oscillospiraceae bacterium]
MITRLSQKVSLFFVANKVIEQEDEQYYRYGLEVLISTSLSIISVIIISIITNRFFETLLYLAGFIPLRTVAGGYHAKTHLRCYLVLIFSYLIFLSIIFFLPLAAVMYLGYAAIVLATVLILVLAPIDDPNRPFTDDERQKFKKRSRLALLVYIAAAVAVSFLSLQLSLCVGLGMLTTGLALLASAIKNKILRSTVS